MTDPTPAPEARPRIRAAAIVWGLLVIAAAVALLSIAVDADRRDALVAWALALSGGELVVVGVIALGAVLTIAGVLSGITAAQGRSRA